MQSCNSDLDILSIHGGVRVLQGSAGTHSNIVKLSTSLMIAQLLASHGEGCGCLGVSTSALQAVADERGPFELCMGL